MTKIINLLVAILLFLLSGAILFPTEKANLGFYQSRSYMISQVEPMVPEGRPLVPEPNPVMPEGEPLVPERIFNPRGRAVCTGARSADS